MTFTLDNKHLFLANLCGNKAVVKDSFDGLTTDINKVLKDIYNSLAERNYNVPDVKIQFWLSTDKNIISIFKITGPNEDVEIVSDWECRVKGLKLDLHRDGSGSVQKYNGTDWEKDKHEFIHGRSFHRKMDGLSNIMYHYQNRDKSSRFEAYDDCGRNYMPEFYKFPPSIHLSDVEKELIKGLNDLLNYINSFPAQEIDLHIFDEPAPLPLTNSIFANKKLVTTTNINDLLESKGITPSPRLLALGIKLPEHDLKDIMHEGYIYCKVEEKDFVLPEINNRYTLVDKCNVEVKLNNSSSVYVIDEDAFISSKREWFEANPGVDRLTDEAYHECLIKKASTMTPINSYDGSFKEPVVIIGRKIGSTEFIKPKK